VSWWHFMPIGLKSADTYFADTYFGTYFETNRAFESSP